MIDFLHFCPVKFLDLAFRLGVVFAIFGFLWGIFNLIFSLLRMGRKKTLGEHYLLKFIQYFFLVDVTFLFCIESETSSLLLLNELVVAGLILILYFVGKLQNQQLRSSFFQLRAAGLPPMPQLFNQRAEIIVISLAIGTFVAFIFFPDYARNPISNWFYTSILDIEDTPVFGFIFKVIGFFVLLGISIKLVNGFTYLLSGAPAFQVKPPNSNRKKEDDFDDFEEIN